MLYVLVVHHKHGENIYPCASREVVDRCLQDYVSANWGWEVADEADRPEDAEAAVDVYFYGSLGVSSSEEDYEIIEFEGPLGEEGKEVDKVVAVFNPDGSPMLETLVAMGRYARSDAIDRFLGVDRSKLSDSEDRAERDRAWDRASRRGWTTRVLEVREVT